MEDLHIKPAEKENLKSEEIEKLKTFKRGHSSLEEAKAHLREFGYKEDKINSFLADGRMEVREDGSVKIKVHPFVGHLMLNNISASTKTRECFQRIIGIPKLLIRADKFSFSTDEGVEEMTKIDPDLKVVKIPDSEHSVHKTHPSEFLELVDNFVKDLKK